MAMETRVALIAVIIEDMNSVEALNAIIHDYSGVVLGRMGIPYRKRHVNIISVAVDAPQDVISALAGKIGMLDGISAKAAYSSAIFNEE